MERGENLRTLVSLISVIFTLLTALSIIGCAAPLHYALAAKNNHEKSQYDDAIKYAKQGIALDPKEAANWYWLGAAYFSRGQYEEAIQPFKKVIELKPEGPQLQSSYSYLVNVYGWLAKGSCEKGQYEEAIKYAKQGIALNPQGNFNWYWLGVAYHWGGQYEEAIQPFKKVIELKPEGSQLQSSYSFLGSIYLYKDNFDEAIINYDKSLALNPSDMRAMVDRGRAYYGKGNYAEAMSGFNKAIENIKPDAKTDLQSALRGKGFSYLGLGDGETAVNLVKQAKSTLDYNADHDLSLIYYVMGNKEKAWEFRGGKGAVGIEGSDYKKGELNGVNVVKITSGSPAEKSGIFAGDVIIKLNNTQVLNVSDFSRKVLVIEPGTTAKIKVLRAGVEKEVDIKVAFADFLMESNRLIAPILAKGKGGSGVKAWKGSVPVIQSDTDTVPLEKTKRTQPIQELVPQIQSDIGTLSLEKTVPNNNRLPVSVSAATESRTALVIGNSAYSSGPLKNPVNDATDMAAMLKKLGFSVTLKNNSSLQEMDEAIEAFGNRLKRGGVGLFYYAGHGVQVNGANYLLPIGAKINKEADVKYQAVDANKILDEMAAANNGLNIVMLDACRDNPFTRSFRNAARGLAIVSSAPSGTFISYSTSPGNVARDGDGRNSPYTAALLQYMQAPGQTISDVFINVRSKVKKETGQVPWELSSLEGRFYFTLQDSGERKLSDVSSGGTRLDSGFDNEAILRKKEALGRERQELAREKQALELQKTLDVEREQLAAERRKVEAERQQFAMGKRAPVSAAGEIARDGRFIGYNDGTVLDTRTNLMWAAKDNGSEINWSGAKSYCENYRGGGYTDWRMPTQDELAGLYDDTKKYKTIHQGYVKLTELIQLTACCPWASESRTSDAAFYSFSGGGRSWGVRYGDSFNRALPVRSAK